MLRTLTMLAAQNALALAHRRWRPRRAAPREGYSILLPVPADLPLFVHLALRTLSRQRLAHANEVIVLPDGNVEGFLSLVDAAVPRGLPVPVRCVPGGPWRERLRRLIGTPNYNHFTQIVRGIDAAQSRYLLLHDADLFLGDPDFLDRQYEAARERGLGVLGISGAKDDWYRANGFSHVAATWEILFRSDWARRFRPFELRSGLRSVGGRARKHDTMLYAQCRTAPGEVEWHTIERGFVHFNSVISTYRHFVAAPRRFEDGRFIVPLLRLLIDGFDPRGSYPEVPSWAEILRCLDGTSDRLVFPEPGRDRGQYAELRGKLDGFFGSGLLVPAEAEAMAARLGVFDRLYLSPAPRPVPAPSRRPGPACAGTSSALAVPAPQGVP